MYLSTTSYLNITKIVLLCQKVLFSTGLAKGRIPLRATYTGWGRPCPWTTNCSPFCRAWQQSGSIPSGRPHTDNHFKFRLAQSCALGKGCLTITFIMYSYSYVDVDELHGVCMVCCSVPRFHCSYAVKRLNYFWNCAPHNRICSNDYLFARSGYQ